MSISLRPNRAVSLSLLVLLAGLGIRADTYPRQPGIDAVHYSVALTILPSESEEIRGEAAVTLRVLSAGVREAVLDLASVQPDGKGMTVTRVTRTGQPIAFEHRENRLRLGLPSDAEAGQELSFAIEYRGVPAKGLRFVTNAHGERTAFSQNWYNGARHWLPMIDHPADKATGELVITTKADYQVISNGVMVEETDLPGGLRRTHWRQDVPISSWLYSIGVARFTVRHDGTTRGIPVSFWVFPQDASAGIATLSRDARPAFEFFSDRIGPYAYAKLAHVEAAGTNGGMEHATNIFYGEKSVVSGNAPVAHEIAHQWFGNAVTESDWNDAWLSEGFATYFALLYTEHALGRDAFTEGLRRSRSTVLRLERSLPNAPVVHKNLDEASQQPINGLVYQKGAWTLHMLRETVGTPTFWLGIRRYYQRYLNGTASTDDFRRVMEDAAGENLAWFFAQWLTRSGVPQLSGEWQYDRTAKHVILTLHQTQPADPFRFSVGVGVFNERQAVPTLHQVQMGGREAVFKLPADAEPSSVELDPGVALLADMRLLQRAASR